MGKPGKRNTVVLNLDHDYRQAMPSDIERPEADTSPTREFPSLGPGPQQPSNMPQAWNSSALRQPQQPPAPRVAPSQQQAVQQQPVQQQQQRSVSAQTQQSQHESANAESQFDGQSSTSGRAGSEQPQDEFPPLGGQLNGRPGAYLQEADIAFSPEAPRASRPSNPPGIEQQHPFTSPLQQAPIGQPSAPQQLPQPNTFAPQMADAPITSQAPPQQLKSVDDMTEAEKWGLPGLLARLRSNDASSAFAMGVDINTLGLDLDRLVSCLPWMLCPFY